MWTFQPGLEDGMMESDVDGGAMNLSQRPSAANSPSDSYEYEDSDETPPLVKALKEKQKELQKAKMRDICSGKDKNMNNKNGQVATPSPPIHTNLPNQCLSLPHHPGSGPTGNPLIFGPNLHQMQQLLQQQLLTPSQLQSFMQQQSILFQQQQHHQLAEIGRKQLEQAIQNLQEQLQVNLLQQSHLIQTGDKKKSSGALQQLGAQQHQLMQQLQLTQRQYLIQQGLNLPSMVMSGGSGNGGMGVTEEHQSLWKDAQEGSLSPLDVSHQNGSSPKHVHLPNGFVIGMGGRRESLNGISGESEKAELLEKSISQQHPLYGHGVCKWPGCENVCEEFPTFLKHMNREHTLDDRSTAQARVQMQVVSQLELQLAKERDRLQAMMEHLHMNKQQNIHGNTPMSSQQNHNSSSESPKDNPPIPNDHSQNSHTTPLPLSVNGTNSISTGPNGNGPLSKLNLNHNLLMPGLSPSGIVSAVAAAATLSGRSPAILQPPTLNMTGPIRRRISDKVSLQLSSGFDEIGPTSRRRVGDRSTLQICEGLPYLLERAGLDVASEIQRNREFYKVTDCRPPFTYASLIRQAIIESPDKQLTLNEIYNWFQNTFCYFRRNQATWKNAIRTNLSLHKCFVRYEDDFGSFWMVDDAEFVKRRHLSRGRPRKYDPTPSPSPSSHHPPSQGMQSKSPTQSPTLYGDAINASLQAALAESNGPFISSLHGGNLSPDQGQSPLETRSSIDSPVAIKREAMSPSSNGIHHIGQCSLDRSEVLSAMMKREHGSSEGGRNYGMSSDGESIGRDDQDDHIGGAEKHEDLAEDLSFTSSHHPLDSRLNSNRFDQ